MPQGDISRRRAGGMRTRRVAPPHGAVPHTGNAPGAALEGAPIVCSFSVDLSAAEPYDPEFEAWLSEQAPIDHEEVAALLAAAEDTPRASRH